MTIFTVSDSSGLYNALASATGGDTIELAAGDYGKLEMRAGVGFDITYDSTVTITSADPDARASFSEVYLKGVANLTFDNVVFDYTYSSEDYIFSKPFLVRDSSDITFRNSLFDGDVASGRSAVDDGYGFAQGLNVLNTAGVVIENNEFTAWHRGLVVSESQDIVISGNDINSIRSDGMNIIDVQSVRIEDNNIHDFKTSPDSPDHSDMIQFWPGGTDVPSTDIIIRNNILDIGDGGYTQTIFMRNGAVDQGLAGEEMFYQNVLIEGNIILNGHSAGIYVGETNGLTIRNNTVLSIDASDDAFYNAPAISVADASTDVAIQQNVTGAINGYNGQTDWALDGNVIAQNTDPNQPGYYADLFFESSNDGPGSVWQYVAIPGSAIEELMAGSSRLWLETTPDTLTPHFEVTSSTETAQTLVFDATHTYGPVGQVAPQGATFVWDFGDGTTGAGRIVEHKYATPGNYDVTLSVVLNGQGAATATTATAEVGIAGDDVLAFNADDGGFYTQGYGTQTLIDDSDAASVLSGAGRAVDLGGIGTKVEIAKADLAPFFGAVDFEMSMTLQADQPGVSSGEVLRVHSSIVVSVKSDGNLNVLLFPDGGAPVNLTTSGISINDGAKHDISIVLDDASDSLKILIDGTVTASETVTEPMPGMGYWGLIFGQPWNDQNFDGKLSAFELDAPATDYPVFEGALEDTPEDPTVPVKETPRDTQEGQDEGALPDPDDTGTDFVSDFELLRNGQLRDDANVATSDMGSTIYLDGEKDYVRLGKMAQFEASEQLSVSVSYSKDTVNTDEQRLVWNNKNVGLSVEGDSLKVFVGQVDGRFQSAIRIDDLGLDDTDLHQVSVMVDAASDQLQVVLDGVLVLDRQQDLDISFADGVDNAWKVGGGRHDFLDGEIYDLRIDASADFLPQDYVVPDDAALMA